MRYQEFKPAPRLEGHVECFWTLKGDEVRSDSKPSQRILPDGCIEMIFHLQDPVRRVLHDGHAVQQPTSFISGQLRRYIFIQPLGGYRAFGVRFRPGMVSPFVKMPVSELTERCVGLDLIWESSGRDLTEQVLYAATTRQRIKRVEAFLVEKLSYGGSAKPAVTAAVKLVIQSQGQISVDLLTTKLGVSSRQLERSFHHFIGLTPKGFSRIMRFQKVFQSLHLKPAQMLTQVALDSGYYDQAHFIKDFKSLTGLNPTDFFRHSHQLSDFFTSPKRLSNFYNYYSF